MHPSGTLLAYEIDGFSISEGVSIDHDHNQKILFVFDSELYYHCSVVRKFRPEHAGSLLDRPAAASMHINDGVVALCIF